MTEHDPLFDHLRRQLHDYDAPPPESVWAGIRQQVPAPRRPRPWRPALLLVVLVLSLTFTARYWRPLLNSAAPVTASRPAVAPANSGSTRSGVTLNRDSNLGSSRAKVPGPIVRSGRVMVEGEQVAPETLESMTIPNAKAPLINSEKPTTNHTITGRSLISTPTRRTKEITLAVVAGKPRYRIRQSHEQGKSTATPIKPALTSDPVSMAAVLEREEAETMSRPSRQRDLTAADGALRPLAIRSAIAQLQTKHLSGFELPLPLVEQQQPKPEQSPRLPSKWSVQVLAGPGLTYRRLGQPATQLQELERPAIGFSGQIMATYAFSPRLTLGAGLGYAQYATTLRYQLVRGRSDSLISAVDFRDQYHFLTLPVQTRLTLGGNHRWRYGVLGGAELAVLLSARTTEGSACHCRQQRWVSSAPDSTFRRLNLALTAGAFASYQFRPGQWLTIQPQGQLFANSLNAAGRTPRRPWSVGLQLGYRWELAPHRR